MFSIFGTNSIYFVFLKYVWYFKILFAFQKKLRDFKKNHICKKMLRIPTDFTWYEKYFGFSKLCHVF